ncbi:hypothetical protein LZF95_00460 [Algoriphagus sp. AGSA1]|uniref:hypothetical protein n=1 Tax=Algoriphagus sp. AGSA1 TaxID=2907213 RepID=UPI001F36C2B8|nr:hypothetical protein [Algoriphagus sp. AGSA1]MCE7053125.1 hypothetical protein [Algoriphagus sp. AGSA1]
MSEIVKRIGDFAHEKRISIRQIENAVGSGNGTLSKAIGSNKDIQTKWVSLFIEKFPEVNPIWLLTGKGEMLSTSLPVASDVVEEPKEEFVTKEGMRQKQEVIEALKRLVDSMEGQLKDKERLIHMKDQLIRELEGKRT